MSEELKPCPFCGATDGRLEQAFTRATEDFAYWSVECLDCACEIASDASQAEADAAWNRRPDAGEVRTYREGVCDQGQRDGWPAPLINEYAGRVPSISRERAANHAHLRQLITRLDAAGDAEAADTLVWLIWWRQIDANREQFLADNPPQPGDS